MKGKQLRKENEGRKERKDEEKALVDRDAKGTEVMMKRGTE